MSATRSSLRRDAFRQERGTWRVTGGRDHDGDEMTVICDIEADVIVVTIF